ncbi:MAG TPA: hypothetical protein VF875_05130 [Anaeromyxobacter sp.]
MAPKPTFTFALHGFVSMSAAVQTGLFNSEGQLSNYSLTPESLQKDKNSSTFDVRHSRFNFSVKGPQVFAGATPAGILEIDFMGGWGAGANGSASLMNRLRIAVAELDWGSTRLQFGQQNDLIFAMAPTSLSHIGQPLGYATGNTGWRRPGIFGFHTLGVNPDAKLELAWEVARGNWNDTGTCVVSGLAPTACSGVGGGAVASPGGGVAAAEAAVTPAIEGRATFNYAKIANVWIAGHYHQVDLTGVGVGASIAAGGTNAANVRILPVSSYNVGAKFSYDLKPLVLTLQGTGYIGRNAAPLVANFGSYRIGTEDNANVDSRGYWLQAGAAVGNFSLWALYGLQKVDEADFARTNPTVSATATPAYQNQTTNVIAMYRDGGFGLSAEWINFKTRLATSVVAATESVTGHFTSKADQYMFTANYFF